VLRRCGLSNLVVNTEVGVRLEAATTRGGCGGPVRPATGRARERLVGLGAPRDDVDSTEVGLAPCRASFATGQLGKTCLETSTSTRAAPHGGMEKHRIA
jgi:hypothetical protein